MSLIKDTGEGGIGLLVTGGSLEAAFAASYFQRAEWDHVIAADAGLAVCDRAGIFPEIIVGDFDSLIPARDAGAQDGQRLLEKYEKMGSSIRRFRPE